MAKWRTFERALTRLSERLGVATGFPADGRSLGLGLGTALEAHRRAARPSDEEIERLLRGSSDQNGLTKV